MAFVAWWRSWYLTLRSHARLLQVADVRDVMMKNIDKVLERGEKLDTLVDKADNLRFQVCTCGGDAWARG